LRETGRASSATGYLLKEEMVGFVFASKHSGKEMERPTKAREVSEARSKGMDHSVIGKPSLRVGLLIGSMLGLSLLLFVACDDQDSAKGGAGRYWPYQRPCWSWW
jgi:hypothetical protein